MKPLRAQLERWQILSAVCSVIILASPAAIQARPRYRHNLERYYGEFLPKPLDACTTCHLPRSEVADALLFEKNPPHNVFGDRLRTLGEELKSAGKDSTFFARLRAASNEDSDGDGVANEVEILAGHAPGSAADKPSDAEIAGALEKWRELASTRPGYAWQPYHTVARPTVPVVKSATWVRNPIDAFIAAEHEARGLTPRPEAPRHVLFRRVSLDITGLAPTPEEMRAFLGDTSSDAYEKAVDRLLSSPRYGERWGRHWMDVWRYSDWAGWGEQVRDSQPHIWRWRDWIVESLNADKGYDRMVTEMLAGDELAPGDKDTLRATGYLARSYKLLSREAWMQECVDHAGQAFLGLTVGCARCHDHMYDPILQREYYELRAFFEPYNVRLDRLPGQPDTKMDGLPRVFDASLDAKTFLYVRGDDRNPDKEHPLEPRVPATLGGPELKLVAVGLPLTESAPEKKDYVVAETIAASEKVARDAKAAHQAALMAALKPEKAGDVAASEDVELAEMSLLSAGSHHDALLSVLRVEKLEDSGAKERDAEAWKKAATEACVAQRWARLLDARRVSRTAHVAASRAELAAAMASPDAAAKAQGEIAKAKEALPKPEKELADAREAALQPPTAEYARREIKVYPASSTGRRLALARWLTDTKNPLAARVAANHIWLRHFGQAIVPSVNDFGLNGRPPSHPALLDWLAAELMDPSCGPAAPPWSMKHIHRLIVTSTAYRMASTPDDADLAKDPDDVWLWRMPSRRLEAEAVRDNVLGVAGRLDESMGGPELDSKLILTTPRRSIYYRHAAEKQAEILKVFDMAGVSECYERKVSVVPQQALALANSELVLSQARILARALVAVGGGSDAPSFVKAAFERVLSRPATEAEVAESLRFLEEQQALLSREKERLTVATPDPADASRPAADPATRAREDLVHALLNHNDFVTVR